MSTNYPGALDSFVNPTATDSLDSATVPHAAQHDNINDSMSAVQVTLGVNPQGGSATVVARLTALDSTVSGKAATNQTMYVGTTAIAINRSSASQTLTGTSIDGNAATATLATSATTAATATLATSATTAATATLATSATTAATASAVPASGITGATLASNVTASSLTSFGTDPTANTQAVDNNSTRIASTAFVLGQASASTPAMSGTAAVGTSTRYARADHVHGSDTTKANLAGANFTGAITTSGSISTTGGGSITSATNVTAAGLTSTGTSSILLGSAGATGGNLVFATTGGTQSLIAATGGTGSQTLPATAGTILNSASTIDVAKITTGTTLPSNVVTSSLTTVGTIGSGTWQGTVINPAYGGTGATTAATARANLEIVPSMIPMISGGTYRTQSPLNTAATSGSQNRLEWTPIFVGTTTTFANIGITCVGLVTAGNVRLGIYSDNQGLPSSRLYDSGAISVTAANTFNTPASFSQTLSPGWYWVCSVLQGLVGTFWVTATTQSTFAINQRTNAQPTSTYPGIVNGFTQSSVTGALPATATPVANVNNLLCTFLVTA